MGIYDLEFSDKASYLKTAGTLQYISSNETLSALELSEIRLPQMIRQYRPEADQTEYNDILLKALQQYFTAG